jgi:DNA-directed RNA polymerase specialized sigma24 family protein
MRIANAVIDTGEHGEIQSTQVTGEAFGEILSSGLPSLYRGAYRLWATPPMLKTQFRDALLAAYTHLDQFKGRSKMSTWLAAIVHNSARMQMRRRLRHFHVPLDETIGDVEENSVSHRLTDRRPSPEDECRNAELGRRISAKS